MSAPNGILVTFPGEGSIFAPVRAGQTIKDFQEFLEQYYLATFSRPGKVEALLHPDFYPESEVYLPLHENAMQSFQYVRSLVAKMQEPFKHQPFQPGFVERGLYATQPLRTEIQTLQRTELQLEQTNEQMNTRWRNQLRSQVQQQLLEKKARQEQDDAEWQRWQQTRFDNNRWGREGGNLKREVAVAQQDTVVPDGLFRESPQQSTGCLTTESELAQPSAVDAGDFREVEAIAQEQVQSADAQPGQNQNPNHAIQDSVQRLPVSLEDFSGNCTEDPVVLFKELAQEASKTQVVPEVKETVDEQDSEEEDESVTDSDTDMEPSVRTVHTDAERSEAESSSDSEEELLILDLPAASTHGATELPSNPGDETQATHDASQKADSPAFQEENVFEAGSDLCNWESEQVCFHQDIASHTPGMNGQPEMRMMADDEVPGEALVEEASSNGGEVSWQEDAEATKQLSSTGLEEEGRRILPSYNNILSLLNPKSSGSKLLKDPTDLSNLPLSESEDQHDEKEEEPSPAKRPAPFRRPPACVAEQNMQLTPSALSPELSSKHAKNVHMQRIVYREMERRRLKQHEESTSELSRAEQKLAQKRQADLLLPVLEPMGYTVDDVWALLVNVNFDTEAVQQEVDKIIEEPLAAHLQSSAWSVSITRKSQRVANLQNLKKEELGYLTANFGKAMRTLKESAVESPVVTPGGPIESTAGPSQLKAHPDQGKALAGPANAEEGDMPAESRIDSMSCRECRDLLLRMTPLVHAPTALYSALGRRAVEEYVRLHPRTLLDCREVTFWQLPSRGADHKRQYASKIFFEVLNNEDSAIFVGRLREMHPICAVYMLVTMEESHNVVNSVFQEVARYVAERLSELDRDALGRLVLVFAKAGVKNPGLFNLVAQECLRRLKLKECEHSLSPKVLCDLFVGFDRAKIWDEELFENLMLRTVSLFDADVKQAEIDQALCGASITRSGRTVLAAHFRLQDLTLICRSLLGLHKPDQEFFRDVADHVIACLEQAPALADRFVGNPEIALSQFAQVFAKGQMFFTDLFEMLRTTAARHRQNINARNLKSLWLALQEQRKDEDKKERKKSQPPERRRGAMGRAVIQASEPELRQPRRAKAREQRQRLAELSENELAQEMAAAERYSGLSNSAKILMSGLKLDAVLDAQEAPTDGKKKKSEILEASTWTNMRGRPKGSRKQLHEELVAAQREARKNQKAAAVAAPKR